MTQLNDKNVAIVVEMGFEQVELTSPRDALRTANAMPYLVSPGRGQVRAWDMSDWGDAFDIDISLDEADPDAYDALLLPGGVMNPDRLRINEKARSFVRRFFKEHKPVAAICHGPWTLIDAGVVDGRRLTSFPSLRTDLENAGAQWVDQSVVVDDGLVTSRHPGDLGDFNSQMVEQFAGSRERAAGV